MTSELDEAPKRWIVLHMVLFFVGWNYWTESPDSRAKKAAILCGILSVPCAIIVLVLTGELRFNFVFEGGNNWDALYTLAEFGGIRV